MDIPVSEQMRRLKIKIKRFRDMLSKPGFTEPDFEEEKCVLENEYYRREITLPQFIEDQLNEVGLPFTQIYRDKKGRKKLVAQFN